MKSEMNVKNDNFQVSDTETGSHLQFQEHCPERTTGLYAQTK